MDKEIEAIEFIVDRYKLKLEIPKKWSDCVVGGIGEKTWKVSEFTIILRMGEIFIHTKDKFGSNIWYDKRKKFIEWEEEDCWICYIPVDCSVIKEAPGEVISTYSKCYEYDMRMYMQKVIDENELNLFIPKNWRCDGVGVNPVICAGDFSIKTEYIPHHKYRIEINNTKTNQNYFVGLFEIHISF